MKEKRLEVSSLRTPQNRKLEEAFREKTPKEENYEKQGRDQPLKLLAQHWLWYPREQRRGISGTLEPYDNTIKREASNNEGAFSNSESE